MGSVGSVRSSSNTFKKFLDVPSSQTTNEQNTWFSDSVTSNYVDWKNGLDSSENKAIIEYTDIAFYTINKDLYDIKDFDDMSQDTKIHGYSLQKAIDKFELNEGIVVWRGVPYSSLGVTKDTISSLNGKEMIFDGFLSTSAASVPADPSEVWISISVPPSTGSGAWIGSMSSFPKETEFLLNAGSCLKFGKPEKVNDHWEVKASYLGRNSKIPH